MPVLYGKHILPDDQLDPVFTIHISIFQIRKFFDPVSAFGSTVSIVEQELFIKKYLHHRVISYKIKILNMPITEKRLFLYVLKSTRHKL